MDLATKIFEIRKDSGLTQDEFAAKLCFIVKKLDKCYGTKYLGMAVID